MEEHPAESIDRGGSNIKDQFYKGWHKPSFLFMFLLIIVGGTLLIIDLSFQWVLPDLLVEAHGVLFDLIFFGIIVSIYDSYKIKRENTKRWQEEIEDYLDWNEKEAMFRIVGNIKRLNKYSVSSINLVKAYLVGADLTRVNLQSAWLLWANLSEANLFEANLKNCQLHSADLSKAELIRTNLAGAHLNNAILTKASLRKVNFTGTDLSEAILDEWVATIPNSLYGYTANDVYSKLREELIIGVDEIEQNYKVEFRPINDKIQIRFIKANPFNSTK